MSEKQERFNTMVKNSKRIVFFGGAGVSTESGIPDFRSVDGLYNQKYQFPPETILSHSFFLKNVKEFFRFYWEKMICLEAQPNITHKKLAELEETGKLSAVVTQNIDGLHQLAGSKKVLELHGSVHRNFCMKCGKAYDLNSLIQMRKECGKQEVYVPYCECGGIIKPDVVLYEEALNEQVIEESVEKIANADMLIIGGTSLTVYPAAGFVRYFQGNHLVLINKSSTPMDKNADLVINEGLGSVFSKLEEFKL